MEGQGENGILGQSYELVGGTGGASLTSEDAPALAISFNFFALHPDLSAIPRGSHLPLHDRPTSARSPAGGIDR